MNKQAGPDINLQNLSDEGLTKLLERTEFELGNETVMKCYPNQAKILENRHQYILKEMHKRKLRVCLPEPDTPHDIEAAKKDFMKRWLNKINSMELERMEDYMD